MIVSDNPANKTLSVQGVSDHGGIHTVEFWGSEQPHAVCFGSVDLVKAVTASLQLRPSASRRTVRHSKHHRLFSLGVHQDPPFWFFEPRSTTSCTQP